MSNNESGKALAVPATFGSAVLKKIADIVSVDPAKVLVDAKEIGIPVESLDEFRNNNRANRHAVDQLTSKYINQCAKICALTGAASGVGGIATVVALSAGDIGNMAAQLYRLNQKIAILHGFDPDNELHQDKVLVFYLSAIGIEGAAQVGIRTMVTKALAENVGKKGAASSVGIRIIMEVVKLLGVTMTKRQAVKIIPFFGAGVGAGLNYLFAKTAGKTLGEAYR